MKTSFPLNHVILGSTRKLASRLVSDRFRLLVLISDAVKKMVLIKDKKGAALQARENFFVFGRLIKASASGAYKSLPLKSVVSIVAATLYFLNPADIIPDIIPMSGLLDDFTIIAWTYNSLKVEIDKFHEWEMSNFQRS